MEYILMYNQMFIQDGGMFNVGWVLGKNVIKHTYILVYVCICRSQEIACFLEGYSSAIEHGNGWTHALAAMMLVGNISPKIAYIFIHMYDVL